MFDQWFKIADPDPNRQALSIISKFVVQRNYRPQRSWAKVISLHASVCPHGGGCLLQIFGGGACSKFSGGVPAPNCRGAAPNFRGGACSKFSGGCLLQIFGGVPAPNFRGGACSKFWGVLKFFFLFFFNLFTPQKNSSGLHPPLPPRRSMRGRYASYWNAFLFMTLRLDQVAVSIIITEFFLCRKS